jgi:dihydrofolate reductase
MVVITGHVFIAASIDGFIARSDGNLDWLMKQSTEGENHGYDEFMDSVDGLIMGRGSYEKVLTFGEWPYTKPVVVLSRSLNQQDIREDLVGRVRIANCTPEQIMQKLTNEGWRQVYVDGGRVIQSFLRDGLIKNIVLTRVPILLGSGISLFGDIDHDIDLIHLETKSYPSGLVCSAYEVVECELGAE